MSATSATGLGDVGLASAVASGLDVSRRTSAITVALTVRPRIVHRGAKVIVSGVAGGCAATDRVTIISRAFAATHSFAGLPGRVRGGRVGWALLDLDADSGDSPPGRVRPDGSLRRRKSRSFRDNAIERAHLRDLLDPTILGSLMEKALEPPDRSPIDEMVKKPLQSSNGSRPEATVAQFNVEGRVFRRGGSRKSAPDRCGNAELDSLVHKDHQQKALRSTANVRETAYLIASVFAEYQFLNLKERKHLTRQFVKRHCQVERLSDAMLDECRTTCTVATDSRERSSRNAFGTTSVSA